MVEAGRAAAGEDVEVVEKEEAVAAREGRGLRGWRPHRQFCLPKMAHLELPIPWHGSPEQPCRPTYLKFENRSRAHPIPFRATREIALSAGKGKA